MVLIVFFFYVSLLFFLIRSPVGLLLKSLRLDRSFAAVSCFGFVAVSILVTIGYKLDLPLWAITQLLHILAILSLILVAIRLCLKKVPLTD